MPEEQINVARVPAIAGLVFRHFQGEQDFPRMAALVKASERPEEVQDEQIPGAFQSEPHFEPTEHLILAEISGELVGYARITHISETEAEREYGLRGYLLPAWRRKGIGGAMLGWLEERAAEIEHTHADAEARVFARRRETGPGGAAQPAGTQRLPTHPLFLRHAPPHPG